MYISTRKAFWVFVLPLPILTIMHFFPESISYTIHQKFDLNAENNFPTWYSSALLLSISYLSIWIYLWEGKKVLPKKFWLFFSIVFAYLSVDEAASIHEAIAPHITWYYLYAPFALAFFIYCLSVLIVHSDKKFRNLMLGGMFVYGTGAIFFEMLWYFSRPWPHAVMQIKYVVEENGEMLGAIIMIIGCLHELNRLWRESSVKEQKTSPEITA